MPTASQMVRVRSAPQGIRYKIMSVFHALILYVNLNVAQPKAFAQYAIQATFISVLRNNATNVTQPRSLVPQCSLNIHYAQESYTIVPWGQSLVLDTLGQEIIRTVIAPWCIQAKGSSPLGYIALAQLNVWLVVSHRVES